MFKSIFAGAIAATALAGTALAADLPRRTAAAAPAPAYKTFNWTGAYAGLNAGYAFGKATKSASSTVGDLDGYSFGGTAGYNQQFDNFVVGVEGDLAKTNIDGATGTNSAKITSLGTVRARAGVAMDRALVYGTAGYAGGNMKVSSSAGSSTKWENGYAVGAGLEYAFTNNISGKAEYLYTHLNDKNYGLATTTAGSNTSAIRSGVNYKF
jgi:outer membrane immunogenic protein